MFSPYSIRFLMSALVVSILSLQLTSLGAQAAGPDPATKCEAAKLKAAGKKAACLATEEHKALLGKPSNPARCENAFIKAFANAEAAAAKAGGVCTVIGNVDDIEGLVDTCIDDITAALEGFPPAPCAQLPATGQTMCYNVAGSVIACPGTGQDGDLKTGVPLSYTDNGDGTVTDNTTGLMWEKKDNNGGLHDVHRPYRWSGDGTQETIWDWIEDINAEGGTGFAGYNDWRIPNARELESIVHYGLHLTIDPVFGLTQGEYWSSTSFAFDTSRAWAVSFSSGGAFDIPKDIFSYVRAVRGGQLGMRGGTAGLPLGNTVVSTMGPNPATKCEVAKLKAAGKNATCLAAEEAKVILDKPSNLAKCETAFSTAFQKAEIKAGPGICPTEGDVAVIEGIVDTCIDNIAAALSGSPSTSPCVQLPATGQTIAYQADKNDGIVGPVAVPDDGMIQAGASLSYTNNGDGTITDNITGLMWEKKDDSGGLHDKDNFYAWSGGGSQAAIWDWLDDINTEGGTGFAGYNDWRIPNARELESIVDYSRFNPAIDPVFSAEVRYWSSTSSSLDPASAKGVDFSVGATADISKSDDFARVRAVRSGH